MDYDYEPEETDDDSDDSGYGGAPYGSANY
jgi:hypothetical protein